MSEGVADGCHYSIFLLRYNGEAFIPEAGLIRIHATRSSAQQLSWACGSRSMTAGC